MSAATWVFDWKTITVAGMFSREESGWVLHGRSYTTPAQGWSVAHDVFHHFPDDRGSYAEEVASFGAQTWFEQERANPLALATSLFSVMALVLENGTRGLDGLSLPAAPVINAHPPHEPLWQQCYEMALTELRETFSGWGDDVLWGRLSAIQMRDRAVGWMRAGYCAAQARFADLSEAQHDFQTLVNLAGVAQEGERLVVEEDQGRITARRERAPAQDPTDLAGSRKREGLAGALR